ncbi:MAG: lipopolysaccharide kinase InaA family protein [Vicinamibacterales bacterium]
MTHANWILTVAPDWEATLGDADRVLDLLRGPGRLVHENDRGSVSFIQCGGATLVVKRSKIQERRLWTRLFSVLRGGEGSRAFRNMSRLREAGVPVPEPVLALERARGGFIVASWHAYRYLEGEPCSCADAALVAQTLHELHQRGWVHRDPHARNFLKEGGRARVIDCVRARPWRFGYARRYDVVLLDKCCPGARTQYPGFSASDPLYILAERHNMVIVRWRRLKRVLRNWLGLRV